LPDLIVLWDVRLIDGEVEEPLPWPDGKRFDPNQLRDSEGRWTEVPGFGSVADAESYFRSLGLQTDLTGLDERSVAGLREMAVGVKQVIDSHPWIMEGLGGRISGGGDPEWRFGGVATFSSRRSTARVRHFGSDAAFVVENKGHTSEEAAQRMREAVPDSDAEFTEGGPWLFINDANPVEVDSHEIEQSIGMVVGGGAYANAVHEMGHVVAGVVGRGEAERLVDDVMDEVYPHDRPRLRKKRLRELSFYAGFSVQEQFAEVFARLNVDGALGKAKTKAARDRLLRIRDETNRRWRENSGRPGDLL